MDFIDDVVSRYVSFSCLLSSLLEMEMEYRIETHFTVVYRQSNISVLSLVNFVICTHVTTVDLNAYSLSS